MNTSALYQETNISRPVQETTASASVIALMSACSIWAITANLFVLVCFYQNRRKTWTDFSRLIYSMTLSELFWNLAVIQLKIFGTRTKSFLCLTTSYLHVSLHGVGIYHILGICIYRNIKLKNIFQPLASTSQNVHVKYIIGLSWFLAIAMTFLPLVFRRNELNEETICTSEYALGEWRFVFIGIIRVIPQVLTNILYPFLCARLWCKLRKTVNVENKTKLINVAMKDEKTQPHNDVTATKSSAEHDKEMKPGEVDPNKANPKDGSTALKMGNPRLMKCAGIGGQTAEDVVAIPITDVGSKKCISSKTRLPTVKTVSSSQSKYSRSTLFLTDVRNKIELGYLDCKDTVSLERRVTLTSTSLALSKLSGKNASVDTTSTTKQPSPATSTVVASTCQTTDLNEQKETSFINATLCHQTTTEEKSQTTGRQNQSRILRLRTQHHKRVLRTVWLQLLILDICSLPLVFTALFHNQRDNVSTDTKLLLFSVFIINSGINPIVSVLCNHPLRSTAKVILKAILRKVRCET